MLRCLSCSEFHSFSISAFYSKSPVFTGLRRPADSKSTVFTGVVTTVTDRYERCYGSKSEKSPVFTELVTTLRIQGGVLYTYTSPIVLPSGWPVIRRRVHPSAPICTHLHPSAVPRGESCCPPSTPIYTSKTDPLPYRLLINIS